MDVTPSPERLSPSDSAKQLYDFAVDQDVLRKGIWFPAAGGPVMIAMYGGDHLLVVQAHSSPPELASSFTYHFSERFEHSAVSSFDSTHDPENLRLQSVNPPRLEDGESSLSPASRTLASIAADIEQYRSNTAAYDIAQLRERITTGAGDSSLGLTLSLKRNLPKGGSELLEILDLTLERATSETPGAVSSFLPIAGWCMQALTEQKLKSGEVTLPLLELRLTKYEAAIRQYVREIPSEGKNRDSMRLRAGFYMQKAEISRLLLEDFREDSVSPQPRSTPDWKGPREQELWRQARIETIPVVQSFTSDSPPELLSRFQTLAGGKDSNNAGGHMRLVSSLLARENLVPTLVTWKHSNKPLGLAIDGHAVAGMQGGQVGIPELGLDAARMTYDSLDPKQGVFEKTKGMILWLPEGSMVTVDSRYAQHFFDTELAGKSLFDL